MRIKRDYSSLPIDEQISKLKRDIKFYFVFSIIWSVSIIALSVVLIIFTSVWELGVGFLILLPVSVWLGGIMQIKGAKAQIKELEKIVSPTKSPNF